MNSLRRSAAAFFSSGRRSQPLRFVFLLFCRAKRMEGKIILNSIDNE